MREVVDEVFAEATPYLQNPEWLKWRISVLIGGTAQVERLAETLEEAVKGEANPTRRTDLKIFLQYLRRRLAKT